MPKMGIDIEWYRLWDRLDVISRSNLKYALWKNHGQKLYPPDRSLWIPEFDPDKEMRRMPHPEGSQWRK